MIRQIKTLMKRIGIPYYVTDLSIEQEAFEQAINSMAEKAMNDNCTPTNPRVPVREIESLYKELCKGGFV